MQHRKYSLEWFDLFITETLPEIFKKPVLVNPVFIRRVLEKALEERKHIRLRLLEDMFNTRDEKNMQVLINRYQVLLIHLIDEANKVEVSSSNRLVRFLCQKLQQCLESLLAFIENDFLKYFDLEQRVPESYHAVCRELIGNELPILEKKLYSFKQDPALVEMILDNLRSFVVNTRVHLPYRIFLYMKAVWYELRFSSVYNRQEWKLPILLEILIRLNYNSPALTNYLAEIYLPKKLSSITETDGKVKLLHAFRRSVSEITISAEGKLFRDLPGIDEQIFQLVGEEIELLYPAVNSATEGLTVVGKDFKMQTTFSVPVLGAIFRIFKEAGAIRNANVKKMLEFVAANYTTLKSDDISYIHIHSSYYDIGPKTKQQLYDLFIQLANTSRKL
ncbi:hypothetical protein DVR12_03045 [Chitinophaga silvatica]|uniref:Uncharacterized protein n=1 Tax=Chitinophaga silvatica TaxID=2282649 RepID=A0A3E1YHD7_9BACT|nr:hypothetical protein [Chitinophaga silvatica]RFS26777.1 hypothetical protein DVR12_03045 [Chitinophaga silvatica]